MVTYYYKSVFCRVMLWLFKNITIKEWMNVLKQSKMVYNILNGKWIKKGKGQNLASGYPNLRFGFALFEVWTHHVGGKWGEWSMVEREWLIGRLRMLQVGWIFWVMGQWWLGVLIRAAWGKIWCGRLYSFVDCGLTLMDLVYYKWLGLEI